MSFSFLKGQLILLKSNSIVYKFPPTQPKMKQADYKGSRKHTVGCMKISKGVGAGNSSHFINKSCNCTAKHGQSSNGRLDKSLRWELVKSINGFLITNTL